jgi:hypothetical protein
MINMLSLVNDDMEQAKRRSYYLSVLGYDNWCLARNQSQGASITEPFVADIVDGDLEAANVMLIGEETTACPSQAFLKNWLSTIKANAPLRYCTLIIKNSSRDCKDVHNKDVITMQAIERWQKGPEAKLIWLLSNKLVHLIAPSARALEGCDKSFVTVGKNAYFSQPLESEPHLSYKKSLYQKHDVIQDWFV